jgi:hypothetical protein
MGSRTRRATITQRDDTHYYTRKAVRGLLRLALNHIERVMEQHHDYSRH